MTVLRMLPAVNTHKHDVKQISNYHLEYRKVICKVIVVVVVVVEILNFSTGNTTSTQGAGIKVGPGYMHMINKTYTTHKKNLLQFEI